MYSKGTGSSNLPLSAINFKGLLDFNKPFFRASIAFMRDSMRDVLKNACGLPVDAKVMQIDFCGADVHVSKHLLRPARVFKMGSHEVAQAVGRKERYARLLAKAFHKVLDARRGARVGKTRSGGFKNEPLIFAQGIETEQNPVKSRAYGNRA